MPRITRKASVVWEGDSARGNGSLSAATGAFEALPFSLPRRIGAPEGKTSPEELLAAAHAGCFAMSLASELTKAGAPPARLEVECEILMDEVEGAGHQIVASTVQARAIADGIDAGDFADATARADEGCPFSALLRRAGTQITIDARLAPA